MISYGNKDNAVIAVLGLGVLGVFQVSTIK